LSARWTTGRPNAHAALPTERSRLCLLRRPAVRPRPAVFARPNVQVFFYRQAERPSVGGAASCAAIVAALNVLIREEPIRLGFPGGVAETSDASECDLCWSNCWQPRLALSLPAHCLVNHFPMSVELTHKERLVTHGTRHPAYHNSPCGEHQQRATVPRQRLSAVQ
jgi:hypothetical protein